MLAFFGFGWKGKHWEGATGSQVGVAAHGLHWRQTAGSWRGTESKRGYTALYHECATQWKNGLQSASHNSFSSHYWAASPPTCCPSLCIPALCFFSLLSLALLPVSLSIPPFLFLSPSLSPVSLPFCFLCHMYEELTPYLFSAAGCLTWKNLKRFESKVGGDATRKGIKMSRQREARWNVR